jgi:hypothetical protein
VERVAAESDRILRNTLLIQAADAEVGSEEETGESERT